MELGFSVRPSTQDDERSDTVAAMGAASWTSGPLSRRGGACSASARWGPRETVETIGRPPRSWRPLGRGWRHPWPKAGASPPCRRTKTEEVGGEPRATHLPTPNPRGPLSSEGELADRLASRRSGFRCRRHREGASTGGDTGDSPRASRQASGFGHVPIGRRSDRRLGRPPREALRAAERGAMDTALSRAHGLGRARGEQRRATGARSPVSSSTPDPLPEVQASAGFRHLGGGAGTVSEAYPARDPSERRRWRSATHRVAPRSTPVLATAGPSRAQRGRALARGSILRSATRRRRPASGCSHTPVPPRSFGSVRVLRPRKRAVRSARL